MKKDETSFHERIQFAIRFPDAILDIMNIRPMLIVNGKVIGEAYYKEPQEETNLQTYKKTTKNNNPLP